MPTILRNGADRFYFFSNENDEPPHIHVDRGSLSAKFWLHPVRLAANHGFNARDLGRLIRIVEMHEAMFLDRWHGYFG